MRTRFPMPDDIDPSDVEGIAEACDDVAVHVARWGNHAWADDLMSATRLLRLLAETSNGGEVMADGRCPHCDCPNRFCACVLMERVRGSERREREAIAEAARFRALFQAAASCIAHNRAKIGKPRGPDERRVLEYLDEYGSPGLGMFWSGKTDGWIQPETLTPDLMREPVGNCCACERPVYADELDDDGWMRKATER